MMPLLFSLGQHHALEVVNRSLREDEKVMAFLDDIYYCSEPNRVGGVYVAIEDALQKSMEARPKWRRSRGRSIPQPGCGEDLVCPLSNKE